MNDEMSKEQLEEMGDLIEVSAAAETPAETPVEEVTTPSAREEEIPGIDTPTESPGETPAAEPKSGTPDPRTVVKETPTKEPAADVPLNEMNTEDLAELVTTLRGQLSDAAAGSFFGAVKEEVTPTVETPTPGTPEEPAAKLEEPTAPAVAKSEWKDKDFLGEGPIDDWLDSREKFNALLNAVAKQAYEAGGATDPTALRTDVLRSIPEVVGKFVSGILAMRTMANEFYETNQDLKPYRNLVAAAANNLSAQHTDWTMGQVMNESAVLARKTLGLRQAAITRKSNETPPGVRPGGTRKTQTPAMTGIQAEINEVLELE